MMRKFAFLLAAVVLSLSLAAQEPEGIRETEGGVMGFYAPDYAQIEKDCLAKEGPLSYKELIRRFAANDTSLGLREMFAFYFGQSYQPGFSPYANPDEIDAIRRVLNKEPDSVTVADAQRIVDLADEVIKTYPADPRCYFYKFIGQRILLDNGVGDTATAEKTRWQFGMLFESMTSTGNGITPEVAIHVVNPAHEYLMMNIYGFRPAGQSLSYINGHSYDVFALQPNEYEVDSLYFCIDRVMAASMKMFGSAGDNREVDPNKRVTSADIPLGTRFVLEVVKARKENSKFRVLEMAAVSDTLVADRDSLFAEPVKENQVVGYFAPMRLYAGSEAVSNCLVFISGAGKGMLYYDSFIQTDGNPEFRTTTNSGMMKGVMMNEMWKDSVRSLRIANIRTRE